MLYVSSSTSTNSGSAPACEIASVVAMNVLGTVTTTSPGCTPAAIRANRSASVPLPTPTQCVVPQNAANASSNCCTMGPPTKLAVARVWRNTAESSFSRSRCARIRSRNGILSLDAICHSQGFGNMPQNAGGISSNNGVRGYIVCDHTACTDDGVFADRYISEDGGAGANRGALLNKCSLYGPVTLGLQRSLPGSSARICVIDEHYTVADEDTIFDSHAFTNKRVTGNL